MSLGMGAMIEQMRGYSKKEQQDYEKALGQGIIDVKVKDDERLVIEFANGDTFEVWDNGQSCCERRYMVCDDNLKYFKGAKLMELGIENAPDGDDDGYDTHEIQFLHVKTSKGSFTVSNHNEHNGYYGGFAVRWRYNEK